MSLAEEFTLLAYADDGTPLTDGMHLDNGLGGALLLDLALAERIDVVNKRVVVVSRDRLGDPLLDETLDRIAADEKARKPGYWLSKFANDTRPKVLRKLVADGVLTMEKDRVLGVFPRTRYPAAQGTQPAVETEARLRMRSAVVGDEPADPRTGALCALVAATDLDRKIFADLDRKRVKLRLKEISQGSWAAQAVRATIEEIQSAILIAIVAATTAGATGSGT